MESICNFLENETKKMLCLNFFYIFWKCIDDATDAAFSTRHKNLRNPCKGQVSLFWSPYTPTNMN